MYNPGTMVVNLILASSYPAGAIGEAGALPWSLPGDLEYFRRMTTRAPSAIIMGRRTWESFGSRPLPRRMNIIVSGSLTGKVEAGELATWPNVVYTSSLSQALAEVPQDTKIWIIGGAQMYAEAAAIKVREVRIWHTEIYGEYPNADAHWKIPRDYVCVNSGPVESAVDGKSGAPMSYRHLEWVPAINHDLVRELKLEVPNVNPCEGAYLALVRRVIDEGVSSADRTGTGTRRVMGGHMRFNLRTGFPAVTTKFLHWHSVVEELLWILSGSTDVTRLSARGVRIWNEDTSRVRLDQRGMTHLATGDAGSTYGHAMRHYGAQYLGCDKDYTGLGVDQLRAAVETMVKNPTDRRIIINLWDPTVARTNCALPPCLLMYIFYVADGELSCMTVQRSGDLMLGVPFNIASSALLTHILANMAGLRVGDLDHNIADAHIYNNHMAAAYEQLARRPFPKPLLVMPSRMLTLADLDAAPSVLTCNDFKLVGYRHHGKLKNATPMAA